MPRVGERPVTALAAGERIRLYRVRRGLSRERLSALAGVSVSWLKQVERGTRQADSLRLLIAVAEALRVQVWDLVPVPRRLAPDGTPMDEALAQLERALPPVSIPGAAACGRRGRGEVAPPAAESSTRVARAGRRHELAPSRDAFDVGVTAGAQRASSARRPYLRVLLGGRDMSVREPVPVLDRDDGESGASERVSPRRRCP